MKCQVTECDEPAVEYIVVSYEGHNDLVVNICREHHRVVTGRLDGLTFSQPEEELPDPLRLAFDAYLESRHTTTWMIWNVFDERQRDVAYDHWKKATDEIHRHHERILKEGK